MLVAVALGLSNFAAAVGLGLAGITRTLRIRLAVVFGFFEAVMPLVGLVVGHRVTQGIGGNAQFFAGGLLIATGVAQLLKARRPSAPLVATEQGLARLVVVGAVLSLDNLVVGFALGARHVNLLAAAAIIGSVSVALSLTGLELGHRLRSSVERWSEEAGAVVLVVVGIAVTAHIV